MSSLIPRLLTFLAVAISLCAQEAATTLLGEAHAEVAAGRYRAAIEKGTQAAMLFRRSGDATGEGRARTESGLARLYSGDYGAALGDFNLALALARRTHDLAAEVTRVNNIGTVFYFLGRYADAMEQYRAALNVANSAAHETWSASRRQLTLGNIAMLYQTLGQYERALDVYSDLLKARQALPPQEQAQLLSNIGALRRRLGDPLKALDTYRQAQALYARSSQRDGEVAVLNNIGIVQATDLRDFPRAVDTFTASLRLAVASKDRPLAVQSRLYRGEALYRAGNMVGASSDFEAAARDAETLGEKEESWKSLYGLARVSIAEGKPDKANGLLRRAIAAVESLRSGIEGTPLSSDFLADKRDVYDLLIERTNDAGDVFRLMEQSRARNLQDRDSSGAGTDVQAFARSLPADTAVFEYWLGRSSAAVLWMTARDCGLERWSLTAQDQERLGELPSVLADPRRREWREAASAASREFLSAPPFVDAAIKRLLIIPDGVLGRLPFEALPLNGSGLLIDRFTVAYCPSARLLAHQARPRGIRWPWQRMMEAYADPAPGAQAGGNDLTSSRLWARLPEARVEVTEIARALGARSGQHMGAQARKEFLARAAGVPVLHFATHAFADPQDPARSYILLAPALPSQRFDYLFLNEVPALPLQGVELATLSACQTEAGKLVRGEGVESFSRAFLAAGTRAVVTSLWSVGDRSTAKLMPRFYSGLAGGEAVAEALRMAKLQFRRDRRHEHPAYWAAFVVNGDANLRLPYAIGWAWLAAPVAAIVAAAALLKMRAGRA